jgi:hypothetical protein
LPPIVVERPAASVFAHELAFGAVGVEVPWKIGKAEKARICGARELAWD